MSKFKNGNIIRVRSDYSETELCGRVGTILTPDRSKSRNQASWDSDFFIVLIEDEDRLVKAISIHHQYLDSV